MNLPVNETNLSLLKRYLYEISFLVLAGCVATLFFKYDNLQIFIRNRALNETIENRAAIKESSDAIRENTKALNRMNYYLENSNKNKTNEPNDN
jgi:hypothetical protein